MPEESSSPVDPEHEPSGVRERFDIPRSLLVVCLIGLGLYLVPMLVGIQRGEAAGQREGGWLAAPVMQKDSVQYVGMARDLADFHLDEFHLRTIGYPLILLATGSSDTPSRGLYVVSLLFHSATILLLGALLSAAGIARPWLLGFGLLMWLPPLVEPAAFVMTENASQFSLILGLAGVVLGLSRQRWTWLLAGGAGLAYSGLVHPTYQVVSIYVLGVLLLLGWCLPWSRIRRSHLYRVGLALMGAFAILIGGALIINWATFGYVGLSPFAGYALSSKTVRVVEQLPTSYGPVREILIAARDTDLTTPRSSHMAASYMWRAKDEVSRVTGLEGVALSKYLVKLNLQLIKEAPLSYVQEVFLAAAAFWAPTSGQGLASFGSGLFHALWAGFDLMVMSVFFFTFLAMAGLAFVARLGRFRGVQTAPWALNPAQVRCRTLLYSLGLSLVIYTTLVVSLFGPGITRYRAPLMPILLVLALVGTEQLWRLFRARSIVRFGGARL